MAGSVWVEMDDEIQRQLALQVELSLDRHEGFLVQHGLAQCDRVVDVGTGSGRFLRGIAVRHQQIHFTGIDNKANMIEIAGAEDAPNVDWLLADALESATVKAVGQADGILMRYFVLHLPETRSSLVRILADARPGTRLWILDLDIDNNMCVPPDGAFSDFVDLVRRFCDLNGVEIRTGALLPDILTACRFDTVDIVAEPFNNREIDPARLSEYLMREASLYHYHLYGSRGERELSPLREFLEKRASDPNSLVQYGMVMIAAVKRSL
jgi:SAM-dependent methyltransferase